MENESVLVPGAAIAAAGTSEGKVESVIPSGPPPRPLAPRPPEVESVHASDVLQLESLDYRGYHVDFCFDGEVYYGIIGDRRINLGNQNSMFMEDIKLFIDEKLDTITRFNDTPKFWGARLKYLNNRGHKDAVLLFRRRMIKIYLDVGSVPQDVLIKDAKDFMTKNFKKLQKNP